MTLEFSQNFDGVINLITATAIIYYASNMSLVEKNGGLKKRLMFLFFALAILCLSRGINYIFNLGTSVESFVLTISSLIPFALFLLIELMLRRHLPLPLKLITGLNSLFLIVLFLSIGINKHALFYLMFHYVFTLTSLLFVIFLKKDLELQSSEKNLIKICMVIMFLIIPLILTDFKKILGWDTIRLGAFGILFFIYSLVKIWENIDIKKAIPRIFLLLIFNLFAAKIICWTFNTPEYFFHMAIIFMMLRMFSDIFVYSNESFSKNIKEMIYKIIESFISGDLKLKSIKENLRDETFYLLSEEDLSHYNLSRIRKTFSDGGMMFKNETLKKIIDSDTREEIIHLYDDFECNACIFLKTSGNNFLLILFKWPMLAPINNLKEEMKIIQNLALKIEK